MQRKRCLPIERVAGDEVVRYDYASEREIEIDWGADKKSTRKSKPKVDKSVESLSIRVAFRPVEINELEFTTIEASIEDVKTKKTGKRVSYKEATAGLKDKKYQFKLGPTGRIEERRELDGFVREIADGAFRPKSSQGRVKEPDLIEDFIVFQYFLWDSISSIEKPAEGVVVGQSWESKLPVPNSMVLRKAMDVTYTLAEIRQTDNGRVAVIKSSYRVSSDASYPRSWPKPYVGRFQMSGTFGFFRMLLKGFEIVELDGEGETLFNLDTGRIERSRQEYRAVIKGRSRAKMGIDPRITINQKLTTEIIKP